MAIQVAEKGQMQGKPNRGKGRWHPQGLQQDRPCHFGQDRGAWPGTTRMGWHLCPTKSCRGLPGPGQMCQMKMAWNDKDHMLH